MKRGRKPIQMPENINWNQPLKKVAELCGVSTATAFWWRKGLGIAPYRVPKPVKTIGLRELQKANNIDKWMEVDWTLQDTVLAGIVGVCRERVRQMRRRLNKPNAKRHHKWANVEAPIRDWFENNMHLSGTMDYHELAETIGLESHIHAAAAAKQYRFVVKRLAIEPVRPWDEINWSLPNKVLSRIWDMPDPPSQHVGFIFARERSVHQRPKAKWRFETKEPQDIEYRRLVAEEESKARLWFAKQKGSDHVESTGIDVGRNDAQPDGSGGQVQD